MTRTLRVIGAPSSAGSYAAGQELAPQVLRERGLLTALATAGRQVIDAGDGPSHTWRPDREHPRAQNVEQVIESITAVAEDIGNALDADCDVLLIGGNCTIVLGVMAALLDRDPNAGLLYFDRHLDLNTPSSTADGALDWMGLAHALDLPGSLPAVSGAFGRRPLLRPDQLALVGIDPAGGTDWDRQKAHELRLIWSSDVELAERPTATVEAALGRLPAGSLAVHLDVDTLDFIDAPLAENTDARNVGPSLAAVTEALDVACHDPRARVLSIGELNPTRSTGCPEVLDRFIATLTRALG
jgi:arginase